MKAETLIDMRAVPTRYASARFGVTEGRLLDQSFDESDCSVAVRPDYRSLTPPWPWPSLAALILTIRKETSDCKFLRNVSPSETQHIARKSGKRGGFIFNKRSET